MEWIAPMGYRVVSVHEASQKTTNRFQDGKVTEISPVMAENWALLISEADLRDDERLESLPGTLVVYTEMGDLAKYQSRTEGIRFSAGLVDRIQEVGDATRLAQTRPDGGSGVIAKQEYDTLYGQEATVKPPSIFLPGLPPPPP
jgi:hypothetical protein